MKKVQFGKLTLEDLKALPFEVVSDGKVIAEVGIPGTMAEDIHHVKTTCPNCGNTYHAEKPHDPHGFLSMQHP